MAEGKTMRAPGRFTDMEGDTFEREYILADGSWLGRWPWIDKDVVLAPSYVNTMIEERDKEDSE